jgi:hypothetical protein
METPITTPLEPITKKKGRPPNPNKKIYIKKQPEDFIKTGRKPLEEEERAKRYKESQRKYYIKTHYGPEQIKLKMERILANIENMH